MRNAECAERVQCALLNLSKLGKRTTRDPDRREQSLIAHFTLLASGHRTHLRTVFRAAHEGYYRISKIAIFPYKSVIVAAFLAHDHHRQHGQDELNSVQYGHLRGCGGSQLGVERSTVYARAACRRNGVGRSGTRPTRARGGGGRRRQWRLGKGARRAINGGEWRGPAPPVLRFGTLPTT